MLKKLRRSSHVTLVLAGIAALSACSDDEQRRDVYKSREDCLADWANKPEDCKPATEARLSLRRVFERQRVDLQCAPRLARGIELDGPARRLRLVGPLVLERLTAHAA